MTKLLLSELRAFVVNRLKSNLKVPAMQNIQNRLIRLLLVSLSPLLLVSPSPARADIFQWEYINSADPSQGKRQSTTLAPDGAGVDAMPGANLSRNLTMAYLIGANLTGAFGNGANLTNADLSQANLTNANFDDASLTGADFTDADIRGTQFGKFTRYVCGGPGGNCGYFTSGTGMTLAQIYSTASYQARDLSGTGFRGNNLTGGNFVGQNLTNTNFHDATLSGADLTGAVVRGARFGRNFHPFLPTGSGITQAQLYSTASYQAQDLTEISLILNQMSGANFAGQKLTDANFHGATLTGANFTDAEVRGASFATLPVRDDVFSDVYFVGGITVAQLYSTASYQAHNLIGIQLSGNNLSGGNFAGQNLTNAYLGEAALTGANFREANIANASFASATLTAADFTGAEVRNTNFSTGYNGQGTGITLAQLYSTASYQAHDLSGIGLNSNDLTGGNFSRQNLTNADFDVATLTGANFREANLANASFAGGCAAPGGDAGGNYGLGAGGCGYATLAGVDLTAADARGAHIDPADAITTNLIRADGHISGLNLDAGGLLVVRDHDGNPNNYDDDGNPIPPIPITIDQHLAMAAGGALRMVFEADAWDSTISFAPGIPVALSGTLELTFANDVNPASQVGRTFDLFNWDGVSPTGAFAVSSPYAWNLSNFYTTGEVTLTAVPEPASVALLVLLSAAAPLLGYRTSRKKRGRI
jgi:uncharacterized protein YjbI with pentapeptide repeats